MSFKKIFFILQFFLCTVKKVSCTLVYTGAHREDYCLLLVSWELLSRKACMLFFLVCVYWLFLEFSNLSCTPFPRFLICVLVLKVLLNWRICCSFCCQVCNWLLYYVWKSFSLINSLLVQYMFWFRFLCLLNLHIYRFKFYDYRLLKDIYFCLYNYMSCLWFVLFLYLTVFCYGFWRSFKYFGYNCNLALCSYSWRIILVCFLYWNASLLFLRTYFPHLFYWTAIWRIEPYAFLILFLFFTIVSLFIIL